MSEMPEHFQQRGPNHFRDDAPYQVCDLCGRKSWASERSGPVDECVKAGHITAVPPRRMDDSPGYRRDW